MVTDALLESLLLEDAPLGDLTTTWLGIGSLPGRLTLATRQAGVASGLGVAARLAQKVGARVTQALADGQGFAAQDELLVVEGRAEALHLIWKPIQNLVEHASAVATRTAEMVALARAVNPRFGIFGTRKHFPGIKNYVLDAVEAGGGFVHRHGNSETILIFDQHKVFFPEPGALLEKIRDSAWKVCEKKIFVEVTSGDEGLAFLKAGADGLQFDKVPPQELKKIVQFLKDQGFGARTFMAAGGVNPTNVADYAATGATGAATSWVYDGKPLDMTTRFINA